MNKNQSVGMYIILGIMVMAFISMLFEDIGRKNKLFMFGEQKT